MWTVVARIILRNRIPILILIGLMTIFMGYHAQNVSVSYKFARILPSDDSARINYDKFIAEFGEEGNTIIVALKDDELFTLDHYSQWCQLRDSIRGIKNVASVTTVADVFTLHRNDSLEKFEVKPISDKIPTTQAEVDSIKTQLQNLPFYKGFFFDEENDLSLMIIEVDEAYLYKSEILTLIDKLKPMLDRFESRSGMEIHTTGLPYIRLANSSKIQKEINLFIFLAIGITTLIMFLFLKSIKATIISMLVVILGVIWVLGFISLLNYELTILTSLIPPLVIVIGVPNAIFLINKYHSEYRIHGNKIKALSRVIRKIGNATLMTNATTASGFATFIITESIILKEFGVIASISIMSVFVLSLLLIPIIYSFTKPPKERHYKHLDKKWIKFIINWMVHTVLNHRKLVYLIMFIILGLSGVGISMMYTTGNISDDFSRKDPVYKDIKFIEKNVSGIVPLEIIIDTKRKKGATKYSTLKKMNELEEKLATFDKISKPISIVSLLKFSRQEFFGGDASQYSMPSKAELDFISSYIPEGDKSTEATAIYNSFLDSAQQRTRISLQVADVSTSEMRELQDSIASAVYSVFEKDRYETNITGASVLFLKGTTYLIKNLFISLSLAVLLISLFMAWMFYSPRMVLISLVPNLIPLLMTAAIMGFAGIPIKPSTILVFSVAFGISVDDTIHFLAKYRQELKVKNWNIGESVISALKETGVSMIYTSIVLFFGFSIFLASGFLGTVALGMLVSITLLIAMFANLVLLPALLLSLEKRITNKTFKEPMIHLLDEEEDIDLKELQVTEKE